jgi:SagB-type dehydrogenase family enzyme
MVDAREYHERTNHSPRSVRTDSHRLDPRTKPRSYKIYAELPRVEADEPVTALATPALTAVATSTPAPVEVDAEPDGPVPMRALCHAATGITKHLTINGREMAFRAAACTGKLYHVDLYAITGECGPAGPGVYHYDPHDDAFDVLRKGDYRGVLAAATGTHDGVATAPVTFVSTSTWWRNAWKYRERTYRHAFWDSGTILANLLAAAHGRGHRAEVVTGFADESVATLLGVDPADEAPLELVPVGAGEPVPPAPDVDPIDPVEEPLSPEQVEHPILADAWRQSTVANGGDATEWRTEVADAVVDDSVVPAGPTDGDVIDLAPVDEDTQSARPVEATIQRRGSLREYSHEPISGRMVATILDRALGGDTSDVATAETRRAPGQVIDCYCLIHAVEGVPSGAYRYDQDDGTLVRVGDTDRETAGHLALDQPVVGDAAANVYLMADVDAIVDTVGNRAYRLAQLEGGIALGRLYLATYAHRDLGGRGFTFYDGLVADHLSPPGEDLWPMTLFALGKTAE